MLVYPTLRVSAETRAVHRLRTPTLRDGCNCPGKLQSEHSVWLLRRMRDRDRHRRPRRILPCRSRQAELVERVAGGEQSARNAVRHEARTDASYLPALD
jgi:hypothetical protein